MKRVAGGIVSIYNTGTVGDNADGLAGTTRYSDGTFGAVTWEDNILVSQEALARAITFAKGSIQVRTDAIPALNSKARVELYGMTKSESSLRRKTEKLGARFVSYQNGTWTFDVGRFKLVD